MTIPEVAGLMVVGWFIIELFRRIILFAYHEWSSRGRNWQYPTQQAYRTWRSYLKKTNG